MKIVLIILTWLGLAAPYTTKIEMKSMDECESLKHRIEMAWLDGGTSEESGYIMECQDIPKETK